MVHDGFDHKDIVNHSSYTKQVVCAIRQVFEEPVMQATRFFQRSAIDNFQDLVEADASFNHPLTGMLRQNNL